MKYIIDRIEGEYAVCEAEDQVMVSIPLAQLQFEVKAGDRISLVDGIYSLVLPDDERKARIKALMDDLWNN